MVIPWARFSPAIQQPRRILGLLADVRSGTIPRYLFAVVVALAPSGYVAAQVGVNEVHVLPRAMPGPFAPTQHVLRTNVDLVLVNVTVLDHAGRTVTGLEPTNFAVLDDKDPQVVRYLSSVDEPISLVVVLDASASMASKLQQARKAFTELVNTSDRMTRILRLSGTFPVLTSPYRWLWFLMPARVWPRNSSKHGRLSLNSSTHRTQTMISG